MFEGEVPSELGRILPLRLGFGERVLAMGEASCSQWNLPVLDAGWVVITGRRVLITRQDSLRRVGAIDTEIGVEDIRYVRRPDLGDKAPTVEVITKDITLTSKFPSWSRTGKSRADAQRLGELVASFMHLPDSEVSKVGRSELNPAIDQSANTSIGAGASNQVGLRPRKSRLRKRACLRQRGWYSPDAAHWKSMSNTPLICAHIRRAIVRTVSKALSFYGPTPATVITITPDEMSALASGGILTLSIAGGTFVVEVAEFD
ncbi:hypothetical protein A20C1_05766 [marine actinobacterium PHSC20C1]|nr:hypothetical protein A20C1_05766 [marine actinobacterium PHSC20C1]